MSWASGDVGMLGKCSSSQRDAVILISLTKGAKLFPAGISLGLCRGVYLQEVSAVGFGGTEGARHGTFHRGTTPTDMPGKCHSCGD